MMCRHAAPLALALLLVACGGDDDPPASGDPDAAIAPDAPDFDENPPTTFGGDRPAELIVPAGYDPATPTPLLLALHGYYSSGGAIMRQILDLEQVADDRGMLIIAPDGTLDGDGSYFWNATDACCDFEGNGVDDEAYLLGLLDDIAAEYNVDASRVYVVGYSNGGFMAHHLACAAPSRIAALISFAGVVYDDPAACTPDAPVSILHVHGTADQTIVYGGGSVGLGDYPGAEETVAVWADDVGCTGELGAGSDVDLIGAAGADTVARSYAGCPEGVDVTLWTVTEGTHFFPLDTTETSRGLLWDWLEAHPRP